MPRNATIALDAMGGDHAPHSVVRGVAIAAQRFPAMEWRLFGDEEVIGPLLAERSALKDRVELVHTATRIGDAERPSAALRTGRESSMWKAIQSIADGESDAVVSGGNTGALMAISRFVLGSPAGILRPAIISFFPTARGETAMLDLGANVDCTAEQLVQFSVMGALFARAVLGLPHPVVGLLNNGIEESKGREEVRAAAQQLRANEYPFTFHGFVEGNQITTGAVDVVVTDGFTGNIALKTAEGTAELYSHFLRQAFKSSWAAKIGYLLAQKALRQLRARVDPRRYNGAVFAGLNGIVVKSHGGSDALGFANAVGVAADMVEQGFMADIRKECERLNWNHARAATVTSA